MRRRTRGYPHLGIITLGLGLTSIGIASCTSGQSSGQADHSDAKTVAEFGAPGASLAEQMGYPADARLLIVHTDDVGLSHSVNRATIEAFGTGLVNSGSVMVPCPWFPEIASWSRANPDADLGIHITLTSEWKHYRWGPVLPVNAVPTLVDSLGFLYPTSGQAASRMDPREAEAEMRAQVQRALDFGMRPTHLDAHMGTVFRTPELFAAYLRVGREFRLPILVPSYRELGPEFLRLMTADDLTVDFAFIASADAPPDRWGAVYAEAVRTLRPGVTAILMHLAFDDEEMRGVTVEHPDFGSGWRQRDFDVFTSQGFVRLLEDTGVQLVTWREIGSLLDP